MGHSVMRVGPELGWFRWSEVEKDREVQRGWGAVLVGLGWADALWLKTDAVWFCIQLHVLFSCVSDTVTCPSDGGAGERSGGSAAVCQDSKGYRGVFCFSVWEGRGQQGGRGTRERGISERDGERGKNGRLGEHGAERCDNDEYVCVCVCMCVCMCVCA